MLINYEYGENLVEVLNGVFEEVNQIQDFIYEIESNIEDVEKEIEKNEELFTNTSGSIYEEELDRNNKDLEKLQYEIEGFNEEIDGLYAPVAEEFDIVMYSENYYSNIDDFLYQENIINNIKEDNLNIDSKIEAQLLSIYPEDFL